MSTPQRLAVYGTLAPGRENHHMLAKYPGTWSRGRVRGEVINPNWQVTGGYAGFIPREDGDWIDVHVFESPALAELWSDLDEFEGSGYRRVLVPVYAEEGDMPPHSSAYIYALAR